MRCEFRRWLAVAAAVMFLGSTAWIRAAAGEADGVHREAFDVDPGWEGFRNRLLPARFPVVRQEFGYRESHFAGGERTGEIGGTVCRAFRRAYYAQTIGPKSLDERLSASGRIAVKRADGGSGVMIGWFNHEQSQGWRTPSSLGFRVDGNGGKYWLFYEYGTAERGTGGAGAFEGDRYQTTKTLPFPADGTVHTWSLDYDPNSAEGRGLMKFRFDNDVYELPLAGGHKQQGATFDRFGIWNVQIGGDLLEMYLDDLRIDGVDESFDADPGWVGEGNGAVYEQRVIRPYHDVGYSDTSHAGEERGEIGGIMFRDEQPMYYADRVGPYTLDDELQASGKIVLNSAGADSAMMLGWFGAEAKRNKLSSELDERQTDYVGILIEGPSQVGHYFRAAYSTSKGSGGAPFDGGQVDERPVIRPDGKVHSWSLHYDPAAAGGRGQITVTFDETTHHLDLKRGERAEGATLDRFGLFNLQVGGHHVEAYLDDVVYSKFRDGRRE